jgi:hypothetical protein
LIIGSLTQSVIGDRPSHPIYRREPEETFDSENAAENYINDRVRFAVVDHQHDGSELPEISGLDLKVSGEWAHAL